MMLTDYIVSFRREETLADAALSWRRDSSNEYDSYFNIIDFVLGVLSSKTKRPFKIEFFDAREGEKPAFVSFEPRILHVDREIWDLAWKGEPDARFIIAHEVGHLLLHDHFAKAFSDDPDARIKSAEPEYSAEWQANVFALYFLLPDMIVAAYRQIDQLCSACGVTELIARQRLALNPRLARLYTTAPSGFCSTCGEFNVAGKCVSLACMAMAQQ